MRGIQRCRPAVRPVRGSAGEAGTLSGTFSFPANSTGVAGCGV
jgi:hypothetical protein